MRDGMVELYRAMPGAAGQTDVSVRVVGESAILPRDPVRASADRLALQAVESGQDRASTQRNSTAAACCCGPPRRSRRRRQGRRRGRRVAASRRRDQDAGAPRDDGLRAVPGRSKVLQGPDPGRLPRALPDGDAADSDRARRGSGCIWPSASRVRCSMLAEGARAIGAGQLDLRLRAGDRRRTRVARRSVQHDGGRAPDQSASSSTSRGMDLERKNVEVDGAPAVHRDGARARRDRRHLARRRRAHLDDERRRGAAARGSTPAPSASRRATCSAREDLRPLLPLVDATAPARSRRHRAGDHAGARGIAKIHLATAATVLTGDDGRAEGARARARRRDAAHSGAAGRGLARRRAAARARDQESADAHPVERRAAAPAFHAARRRTTQALVDECTDAIITEVEALKGLVDEFAQFARLRGPRMVPADLNQLVDDTLKLYAGVLQQGRLRVERAAGAGAAGRAPRRGADPAGHHQSGRQRHGGAGRARRAPPRPNGRPPLIVVLDQSRRAQQRRAARRRATTAPACPRPIVTNCSCRTTRRRAAAAVSAWRSCGASSSSTAAASRSATRSRRHDVHGRTAGGLSPCPPS